MAVCVRLCVCLLFFFIPFHCFVQRCASLPGYHTASEAEVRQRLPTRHQRARGQAGRRALVRRSPFRFCVDLGKTRAQHQGLLAFSFFYSQRVFWVWCLSNRVIVVRVLVRLCIRVCIHMIACSCVCCVDSRGQEPNIGSDLPAHFRQRYSISSSRFCVVFLFVLYLCVRVLMLMLA